MEAEVRKRERVWNMLPADFEDEGRDHEPNAESL